MLLAIHYAEIGLKGRNRPRFEGDLAKNLERQLEPLGRVRVKRLFGRLLVELDSEPALEELRERIGRVFGVAYWSVATVCDPDLVSIEKAVDEFTAQESFASFGVRARRADKSHPFTSAELARHLGARVQAASGAGVDLGNPELWIEIHVLSREAIVLHGRQPGPGGLPVGSAGRVLSMISGGIDSPVASWLMLKRGCALRYVHFHSSPFTSPASQDKVRDVVARLARHQGPVTLYLAPFAGIQQVLVSEAPAEPRIVLYRRFMLRLAEALARRERALGIVTGESLGQVSSQTLGNMDTINRAATLPVLRPLVGFDKSEIIERARAIGTFEISIEPDEDCCSYLMPRKPATWTRPEPIAEIEAKLDVAGMVEQALAQVQRERIEPHS